ncbi:hypothetical protein EDC01DRAFT_784009 [Geopyxis carbonaria]|nr:hypothetical protein EDC01DRAFT_784009 [Geopyxis carbonaria]
MADAMWMCLGYLADAVRGGAALLSAITTTPTATTTPTTTTTAPTMPVSTDSATAPTHPPSIDHLVSLTAWSTPSTPSHPTSRLAPSSLSPSTPLPPNHILTHLTHLTLTSNNTSYARVGHLLGYWTFFPAPAPWGRLPVYGIATVLASTAASIPPGTRLLGMYPASTYHLAPAHLDASHPGMVLDGLSRSANAALYRGSWILAASTASDSAWTTWFVAAVTATALRHHLAPSLPRDATLLVVGATSRCALACATLLRPLVQRVVGASHSRAHAAWAAGAAGAAAGVYDAAFCYEDADAAPAVGGSGPVLVLEFSGRREAVGRVVDVLGGRVWKTLLVGGADFRAPRVEVGGGETVMVTGFQEGMVESLGWRGWWGEVERAVGAMEGVGAVEIVERVGWSEVERQWEVLVAGEERDPGVAVVVRV